MIKKIALFSVPSIFLLDEKIFPFLGVLKIAAAYQQQGYVVDVIDLNGITNYLDVIQLYLEKNYKDLYFVGCSSTTPQMPACYQIAKHIKNKFPDLKLVLGGAHGTLTHTATKSEIKKGIFDGRAKMNLDKIQEVFDVLVCGDGELTLGHILSMDKGVIDVDDRFSPMFLTDKMLNDLPDPARHLIDLDQYHYYIEGKRATSIISQYGCSMGCFFCSGRKSPYLRLVRNRNVHSVVSELEFLYKTYGYEAAMIYDDELNLVHKNCIDLMNGISDLQDKLGIEFRLRGFIKAELFNEEQARAMYRSGFRWILSGFESGDERILININKRATREDNSRVIEIAKKVGLKTKALMSLGHNGESYETIENTKRWLLENNPDDFDSTTITSMPGSPIFDDAIKIKDDVYVHTVPKTGDKLYQRFMDYTISSDFYKGKPGEYVSYVWTDYLTAAQLVVARDELESEVRAKLNIPFNQSAASRQFDHSMGQGNLPDWILRSTETHPSPIIETAAAVPTSLAKSTKHSLTVVK